MKTKYSSKRPESFNFRKTPLAWGAWLTGFLGVVLLALGCGNEPTVRLRKLPYPYEAALAIASDIDETESIEELLVVQRFLCTNDSTEMGRGLGLEIGNTFWFYNDMVYRTEILGVAESKLIFSGRPDYGISLFVGLTDSLQPYADTILALIESGHIDCVHSLGHFLEGGFDRELADRAYRLLASNGVQLNTWINHGGPENEHNLGTMEHLCGDNLDWPQYHADLTLLSGIHFFWDGQMTHIIGNDGRWTAINQLKQLVEWAQDLRHGGLDFDHDGSLLQLRELDDGQIVFGFPRYINNWGVHSLATEPNIYNQLGPAIIDELIDNKGLMIFYTHFGTSEIDGQLSDSTLIALRYIAEQHRHGSLLITSTSRLLNYRANHQYLYWRYEESDTGTRVVIDSVSDPVRGCFVPDSKQLRGLTFYIDKIPAAVYVDGSAIPTHHNPPDGTGWRSITIAWDSLVWPL